MKTRPNYVKWYNPSELVSLDSNSLFPSPGVRSVSDANVPTVSANVGIRQTDGERKAAPGGEEDSVVLPSFSFKVAYNTDEQGQQVPMLAGCFVKLTEDDWGQALIDDAVVVDMSEASHLPEAGDEGGHTEWSLSNCVQVGSGDHTFRATNLNIYYSVPSINVAVCEYELYAYPIEAGGKENVQPCPCAGNTCDNSGGMSNGIDLTKNVSEAFGPAGYIRTRYDYTPFGSVTATGDVTQPIQWSSEFNDKELGLVYYNYRHYNPEAGRWINRDPIGEKGGYNLYGFVGNSSLVENDYIGLTTINNFDNYRNYDEDLLPLNKKHELIVTFNCAGLATRTFKIMNLDELLNNYLLKGKAIRCLDRCKKCQIKFWLWVYDTIPILISENEEKVYEQDRKKDFHVVAGKVSCEDGSDKANVFSKNGMRPIEGPAIGSTFRPKVREQARENSPTNEPMLINGKRVDIWRDKIVESCFCLNHENIESK